MSQAPEQEIALVKQQASKALTAANDLKITNAEEMVAATDILSKIKTVAKMVKDRKEAITKPLNEALASARDLFRPVENDTAEAERVIKRKMLDWQDAEDRRTAEAARKLAERVEKGTMKPETAVAKIQDLAPAPTSVKGNVGAVKTSIVKKVRFGSLSHLKLEELQWLAQKGYIVWNESPARKDAIAGTPIPGAEVYEEKQISAR